MGHIYVNQCDCAFGTSGNHKGEDVVCHNGCQNSFHIKLETSRIVLLKTASLYLTQLLRYEVLKFQLVTMETICLVAITRKIVTIRISIYFEWKFCFFHCHCDSFLFICSSVLFQASLVRGGALALTSKESVNRLFKSGSLNRNTFV